MILKAPDKRNPDKVASVRLSLPGGEVAGFEVPVVPGELPPEPDFRGNRMSPMIVEPYDW